MFYFLNQTVQKAASAKGTFLNNFSAFISSFTDSLFKGLNTDQSGPGSVVGIATAYGLDGPGFESRWGEIFRTSPDRP